MAHYLTSDDLMQGPVILQRLIMEALFAYDCTLMAYLEHEHSHHCKQVYQSLLPIWSCHVLVYL